MEEVGGCVYNKVWELMLEKSAYVMMGSLNPHVLPTG